MINKKVLEKSREDIKSNYFIVNLLKDSSIFEYILIIFKT